MSSETSSTEPAEGSCLCGAAKYLVSGNPVRKVICHCKSCKKSSGTMFATNSFYQENHFTLDCSQDQLKTYADKSCASGGVLNRSFCITCGTTLFTRPSNFPGIIVIACGTLDFANDVTNVWTPEQEFFCKRKGPWLESLAPLAGEQFQSMT